MKNQKKVILGSDHAGRINKENVEKELIKLKIPYEDFTPENTPDDSYVAVASEVSAQITAKQPRRAQGAVRNPQSTVGILLCGTGIGMSIAANKVKGIRAALVHSIKEAKLARSDDDANILILPGSYTDVKAKNVKEIIKAFLNTKFKGGKYKKRINKLNKL